MFDFLRRRKTRKVVNTGPKNKPRKTVRFAPGTANMPPNANRFQRILRGGMLDGNREAYQMALRTRQNARRAKVNALHQKLLPGIRNQIPLETYRAFVANGRLNRNRSIAAHRNLFETYGNQRYLGTFAFDPRRRLFVPTASKHGVWYRAYRNNRGVYYEAYRNNNTPYPQSDKFLPQRSQQRSQRQQ